jgi:protein-disulfide isomerase
MQKIFTNILLGILLILVALFAYKILRNPEIVKTSLNEAQTDVEKAAQQVLNQPQLSEEELNAKIHDYILSHPEVLVESLEAMQRKKIEESNKQTADYLLQNKSNIESEGAPPIFGNKEGDITVVVFYDYNCSFCKQANLITNEILDSDTGVKIILRPLPILGGTSMYATKIALAVHKISEEKFPLIHNEMMKMKPITEEGVKALLVANQIDFQLVENEINSFAIKELIAKNFDLAKNLGIKGAPSYVVNGIFIPGLVDKEKFTSIIGELRQIAAQAKTSESVGIDKNNLDAEARNDEGGDPEKAANPTEENSNRSN